MSYVFLILRFRCGSTYQYNDAWNLGNDTLKCSKDSFTFLSLASKETSKRVSMENFGGASVFAAGPSQWISQNFQVFWNNSALGRSRLLRMVFWPSTFANVKWNLSSGQINSWRNAYSWDPSYQQKWMMDSPRNNTDAFRKNREGR